MLLDRFRGIYKSLVAVLAFALLLTIPGGSVLGGEQTTDDETVTFTIVTPQPRTLTVDKVGQGTVEIDGDPLALPYEEDYDHGTTVSLEAIPSTGWSFDRWQANGITYTEASIDLILEADVEAIAHFTEDPLPDPDPDPDPEPDPEPAPPPPPPPPPPSHEMIVIEVDPDEDTTVEFDDGKITIIIPAGSLPEGTILTITLVPVGERPGLRPGATGLAGMYRLEFSVDGEKVDTFDHPISIIIQSDLDDSDSATIFGFVWDPELEEWLALPTEVDKARDRVLITTSRLSIVTVMEDPEFPLLTDIPHHWGWEYILRMASLGVVSGYPDQTFRPDRDVTRAEFAKMVVESAGFDIPSNTYLPFDDVADIPQWARPYVAAAYRAGVIRGYPDNTFRPHVNISRAEMAAMLVRATQADLVTDEEAHFPDEVPEWALDYINTVGGLGLMRGFPDGTFRADAFTTRAESCTVLWRMMDLLFR